MIDPYWKNIDIAKVYNEERAKYKDHYPAKRIKYKYFFRNLLKQIKSKLLFVWEKLAIIPVSNCLLHVWLEDGSECDIRLYYRGRLSSIKNHSEEFIEYVNNEVYSKINIHINKIKVIDC
jgi:hypothetical protein